MTVKTLLDAVHSHMLHDQRLRFECQDLIEAFRVSSSPDDGINLLAAEKFRLKDDLARIKFEVVKLLTEFPQLAFWFQGRKLVDNAKAMQGIKVAEKQITVAEASDTLLEFGFFLATELSSCAELMFKHHPHLKGLMKALSMDEQVKYAKMFSFLFFRDESLCKKYLISFCNKSVLENLHDYIFNLYKDRIYDESAISVLRQIEQVKMAFEQPINKSTRMQLDNVTVTLSEPIVVKPKIIESIERLSYEAEFPNAMELSLDSSMPYEDYQISEASTEALFQISDSLFSSTKALPICSLNEEQEQLEAWANLSRTRFAN